MRELEKGYVQDRTAQGRAGSPGAFVKAVKVSDRWQIIDFTGV